MANSFFLSSNILHRPERTAATSPGARRAWRPDYHRSGRPNGFTLIEILVVLVVLGLIAGLVINRGPPAGAGIELRAVIGQVSEPLRTTRSRAIAANHSLAVTFDPAHRGYWPDGGAARPFPVNFQFEILAVSELRPGPGLFQVTFAADGSSSGGRILFSTAARRTEVFVDWLTGRVHVSDVQ